MRVFTTLIIQLLTTLLILSCVKSEEVEQIDRKVELYLLQDYQTIGNTDHIDESSIILNLEPLLMYHDFVYYNAKEFKYVLTEHGKEQLDVIESYHTAFAVLANEELIYTGYFVPGFSSRGWFWNVIDPISASRSGNCYVNRFVLQSTDRSPYPDKRNDARILDVFRSDGNLVE